MVIYLPDRQTWDQFEKRIQTADKAKILMTFIGMSFPMLYINERVKF